LYSRLHDTTPCADGTLGFESSHHHSETLEWAGQVRVLRYCTMHPAHTHANTGTPHHTHSHYIIHIVVYTFNNISLPYIPCEL
jgi:hypothetical protein